MWSRLRQLAATSERTASRLAFGYLGLCGCALALYPALPDGAARGIDSAAVAAASLAGFAVGIGVNRPRRLLPWCLFVTGFGLWIAGTALGYVGDLGGGPLPFPSAADVLYVLGYPPLLLGTVLLARLTRRGAVAGLLDASIVGTGIGLFVWQVFLEPDASGSTVGAHTLAVAYPTLDFVLLAAVVQLLASPRARRLPSLQAFLGGFVVLLVADSFYSAASLAGRFDGRGSWVIIAWLGVYALWGFASLHPSIRRASARDAPEIRLTQPRLALLAGACLAARAGVLLVGIRGDLHLVVFGTWGTLLVVLVFARMALLFRDRDRSEHALRESEARLRALFDSSLDGILISDDAGHYVDANPAACEIVGRLRAEIVGATVGSFSEPRPAQPDLWSGVGAAGEGRHELTVVRPDGRRRAIEAVAVANYLPGRHAALLRDIEERARTEAALRAAETRYRSLVEQLPLVTYVNHPSMETVPLYISPQIEQLFGYPLARWREDPHFWKQVLHPDDRERIAFEIERLRDDGRYECEYRNVAADGSLVWVLDQMVLIRDEHGEPLCHQGFLVDITERKRAEEALQGAEARYRTLVEQLPLASYVNGFGAETKLTYMSPQIEQLLGYPQERWLADPELPFGAIHPDDRASVRAEAARARRDLDRFRQEYRLLASDGRVVWVLDEMVVVRAEDGEPFCFQGFLVDITERKQLEEQLQQSQRLEVVGRLAGGIAHDFNNLLTAITGYSGFALERLGADERLRRDLEEVSRAAERAASLTQQLLAFSRSQVLQPRPLDLNGVVRDVQKLLTRLIGEDVELAISTDARRPCVLADPGRLEQVLVNLAVNARDALPGGGTLTIETGEVLLDAAAGAAIFGAPAGRYATIAVHDTGCGMQPETQARAFEPFFTTKEVGNGTGLGLSTVYGIVKQSGGWIMLASEPGVGTECTIYLPLIDEAPEQKPEPAAIRPRGAETVLLVEDEAIVRSLVGEMLERQGYTVVEAGDPHEALAAAEQGEYDLLLTDVVMPRMNGRELASRLRERRPELQVVFTSGYAPETVIQRGGLDPGERFLQKPFSEDELAAKVREALDAVPAAVR